MVSLWKQVMANAASLTFNLCISLQASLQLEQFHIKYKCGVRGDDPGVACRSISHIWCAGDFSPLAQAHLCYSFFPTFNDLHSSDLELEGLVPVSRGVKLFPILQHTYVMNNTCLTLLWKCSSITGGYCFDFYAHGCATSKISPGTYSLGQPMLPVLRLRVGLYRGKPCIHRPLPTRTSGQPSKQRYFPVWTATASRSTTTSRTSSSAFSAN